MELEAFVAVAEELHFGRAAARLHRGQPTVSDAVRRLESTLGGRLFHRTSRRVSLTDLGEALLPDAHATLAQLRRLQQRGRSWPPASGPAPPSSSPTPNTPATSCCCAACRNCATVFPT